MKTIIELISRVGSQQRTISSIDSTAALQIAEPSVVLVHASVDSVASYARQGDDLLIQQDAGSLHLAQFFKADDQGQASDLVLGDTLQTATYVTFSQAQDQAAAASADEAVVLTPQLAALPEALAQTLANVGDEARSEEPASTLQAEAPVLLAGEAASLTIDAPLAGDDVISAAEYGQALEITGTSTGLQTDDVVLVVLNGKTYSTAVEADGSWKVVVLAEDMIAVPAGVASIAASVTSASGAVVQDSHSVFVITGGVQVTIDELAGDSLLNAAEAQMPLSVTGSVNNASEGDEVVVSVLDREYTGVVDAQGQWSVEVPADIWQRLTDGDISVTATVTNAGGNSGSATRELTLDTQMPTVAINTLAEDDIVNAVEHGQALEVTGTTTGLQGGEIISVELGGQTYTSTVSASGDWSVVVRAGDVAALSDGEHTLTATVESHAGNPASGEHSMVVNTVTPTVTVNSPLAGDGVIDATELHQSLEVSGTSTGLDEGSIVNIAIGDHYYTTEVEADGRWFLGISRLEVSTFEDGLQVVSVSAENPVGNRAEATDFVVVRSDQGASSVGIDPITGDDRVNAAEAANDMAITGTTTNTPAGSPVTVSLGGKNYTGTVAADGSWSVPVPADAWAALADGTVQVTASVSSAGNATAARNVLLDTEAPTLTLNPVAGDDIINAVEQQQALEVSGTASGLVGGEVVTVELNGKSYTTTVGEDGQWALSVDAPDVAALMNGDYPIVASVSDAAGNPASIERDVTVATSLSTVTITTPLAGDDMINAVEQNQPLEISGTSTGLAVGELVDITLNGKDYSATVEADGSWMLVVPVEDVSALPDGATTIVANATDSAGNVVEASHQITVDSAAPAIIIDPISDDDVINAEEAAAGVAINGKAEPGAQVVVKVGGNEYTVAAESDSTWSVMVPADVWDGLPEGEVNVKATATDSAGNSGSAERGVLLDTTAPAITIDPISDDDVINAGEAAAGVAINGSAEPGAEVVVQVGGNEYTVTAGSDQSWSVMVPAEVWENLPEGEVNVTATATDKAGNSASAERDALLDTSLSLLTVDGFIDDVGAVQGEVTTSGALTDDTAPTLFGSLNAPLKDGYQLVLATKSGGVIGNSGLPQFEDAFHITDTSWSFALPESLALSEGINDVFAYVWVPSPDDTNFGLIAQSNDFSIIVDSGSDILPTLSITAPVAGDDVIDASEYDQPLEISGTSTDVAEGDVVHIALNGKDYSATVEADGSWTLIVPAADVSALPDGKAVITATASDPTGNAVDASHEITVDSTPFVPSLTIDGFIDDVGASQGEVTASGTLTDDATPTLFGTLSAPLPDGYAIVLYSKSTGEFVGEFSNLDSTSYQITDTSWSYTLPAEYALPNGVSDLEVWIWNGFATDGVFHVATSNTFSINVDGGAGAALGIDGPLAGDGVINAIEHGQALEISGTSTGIAAGDVVKVTMNGKEYAATVAADGSWTLNVAAADVGALQDGKVVIAASTAGGDVNAQYTLDVDTTPPSKIANITRIDDDTGTAGDFITSDTTPVIYGGTGGVPYSNMRVEISLDGGKTWQGGIKPASPSGSWQYAIEQELADGEYVVMSRLVDPAGNWSQPDTQTLIIDTTAPTATVTVDSISEDTGRSASDFLTNDTSPTLHGSLSEKLAEGETLQVSVDGGETWAAAAVDGTRWSYADGRVLSDGQHAYQTRLIDVAGNISAGASKTITIDTAPPSKVAYISKITDDTGADGDFVTSDTTPVIYGSTNGVPYPNMRVEVSLDGGKTWQGSVKPAGTSGYWQYTIEQDLPDGEYDVMSRLVDPAGNWSRPDTVTMIVDTTAPTATVTVDSISEDSGRNATDFLTKDSSPTLNGKLSEALAADETLQVSVDGGETWTAAVVDGTRWSYSDGAVLADGTHTYQTRLMDAAGNVTAGASQAITIDTAPPSKRANITAIGGDTNAADGYVTSDSTPVISGGTAGYPYPEMRVEVSLDGGETWDLATVPARNSTGSWEYVVGQKLADGEYDVMARLVDPAGNWSRPESVTLTIDSSAPSLLATTYSEQEVADHSIVGTVSDDHQESTQANDHFSIGNGGNDTLTYRLLDAADATGGNGGDHVNGFTVGKADTTSDADRIDLSELLADSGYQGAADGKVDAEALAEYLNVTVKGSDTEIAIDRDGAGTTHEMTTLATLSGVQTDLATLLANHQLVVS